MRRQEIRRPCSVDGCPGYSHKGGLCQSHAARKERGLPMDADLQPVRTAPNTMEKQIANVVSRENGPITADEVFQIMRRATALGDSLNTMPESIRGLALVLVVTGRNPEDVARAEEYERELAAA
jgi:hypothetical protein